MISAIILSKNNGDTLDACLKSVVNSLPYDKEVIVVDGKSTDNTSEILAKYKDKIKVVYDEGKGLGWARNVGVRNAGHAIIAFVDSDVICAKDHFLKFLQYFKEHPDVGAIDTFGIHPQVGTSWQKVESLLAETSETSVRQRFTLGGWSIAFRRSVFDVVGGFWRTGGDDMEFSYKARAKGFKIRTGAVETSSWHMPRRTLIEFVKEMELWARNAALFYYAFRSDPLVVKDFSPRRVFRFCRRNVRVFEFVTYLFAPYAGIKYLIKTKKLSVYIHFIVRQYAWLLGYIQGNLDIFFKSNRLVGVTR